MNDDIPHLDSAMWAFDDAGLPYPEVPADSATMTTPLLATVTPIDQSAPESAVTPGDGVLSGSEVTAFPSYDRASA